MHLLHTQLFLRNPHHKSILHEMARANRILYFLFVTQLHMSHYNHHKQSNPTIHRRLSYYTSTANYLILSHSVNFTSKYIKLVNHDIPGHGLSSQPWVSEESPVQSEPPLMGEGELQSLLLVCEPAPQVTLQSAYALQFDHAPSTIVLHINNYYFGLLVFN